MQANAGRAGFDVAVEDASDAGFDADAAALEPVAGNLARTILLNRNLIVGIITAAIVGLLCAAAWLAAVLYFLFTMEF